MNRVVFGKLAVGFICIVSMVLAIVGAALPAAFDFVVAGDMRSYSGPGYNDKPDCFRGVCEAIAEVGPGAFMVCPGDLDPVDGVDWTIRTYLGETYPWYPVVGNHELPGEGRSPRGGSNMDWLRAYNEGGDSLPNVVNIGPPGCEETTYSFDYENTHFIVLNEYFDGESDTEAWGDISDVSLEWLEADLAASDKQHAFVFGHVPAYRQIDTDTGANGYMIEGANDPDTRIAARWQRFWNLLVEYDVAAYICGHTHNFSAVEIEGVWQIDAGHSQGMGGNPASPSTFVVVHVDEEAVSYDVYRLKTGTTSEYELRHSGVIR